MKNKNTSFILETTKKLNLLDIFFKPVLKNVSKLQNDTETFISNYYAKCIVTENRRVTHNVHFIALTLSSTVYFQVPLCGHLRIKVSESTLHRSYTPIPESVNQNCRGASNDTQIDKKLYFLIKSYDGDTHSSKICKTPIGSTLRISGPIKPINFKYKPSEVVYMIAAGSGITPMLGLLVECIKNKSSINILYCVKTFEDIIWREELESTKRNYENLSLTYILSQETSEDWKGHRGRINAEIINSTIEEKPAENISIYVCGSREFNSSVKELTANIKSFENSAYYFDG